jgi:hypothetical protein
MQFVDAMTEILFPPVKISFVCVFSVPRVFVATFCDGHPLLMAPRRQLFPR